MISVLLAVYNTSKYLSQCFHSILNQTYKDLEVIVVNDASTDNSLDICRRFERIDSRVKVVNLASNVGIEKVRLIGLKESVGDFIMFVDSDDWLNGANTLELMLAKIEETGTDYVAVQSQRVMDKWGIFNSRSNSPTYGLIKQPELYNEYYNSFFGINLLSVSMWGKLYRRSTLEKMNLEPCGIKLGEDLYFNMILFPHLKSIYIMNYVGYNYRYGGITTRYNPQMLLDYKKLFVNRDKLIKEQQLDVAYDFLRAELKNAFRTDICQRIVFNYGDKDNIIQYIKDELQDPLYQEIHKVRNIPGFHETPFVIALKKEDVGSIYDQCVLVVRQQRWRRFRNKITNYILGLVR